MKKFISFGFFALILLLSNYLSAQTAHFPIVKGFGGIYEVPDAEERPDGSLEYKILVDLTSEVRTPSRISRFVDNIARLMNLHGLAGLLKIGSKSK
jgi:hypothetical protein